MRRLITLRHFVAAIALLAVASCVRAQGGFTTVTGTITDPNGLPYDCGTISAVLVVPGGTAPTLNGVGFSGSMSPVGLGCSTTPGTGVSGSFSFRVGDNGVILPSGTQWRFTVNIAPGVVPPAGFGPRSFVVTTPINCATNTPAACASNTIDLSPTLSASALALSRIAGSTPALPLTSLQYNNTGVLGGSHFDYTQNSFACEYLQGNCDAISSDASFSAGINLDPNNGGSGLTSFNKVRLATASAANGGGGEILYTANSTASKTLSGAGPQAIAGFFRASVITNAGAPSVAQGLVGRAATDNADATNGQVLEGVVGVVALNKTTPGTFVSEAVALQAAGGVCDFGGCTTIEKANVLYGLRVADQGGFSTVEGAAIKIVSQTNPSSGTKYSIKADSGSGIANFADGSQVSATAFASLPACAAANEGLQRAVTDSNTNVWGANIAAGGANHVLGYCDGTNWTVMAK